MSTSVQQMAQQICREFVNKARNCFEEEGDLERALYYLDKAQGKADEQLRKEIRDLRPRIVKKQQEQIQSLEKKIQQALIADPFNERVVQVLIDQLENLTERGDRVQAWRQEAIDKAARWREIQKVAQVKEEIEGLFVRAAAWREQGVSNGFVMDVYKQAVEAIRVTQTDYPHNDDVAVLHTRAITEYNQFRAQTDFLIGLAMTGQFRDVLARLDEHKDNPDKRFAVYDTGQLFAGYMTASEARRFYIRQASVWVQNKTPEKLSDARRTLYERHAPDAARQILDEFKLMLSGLMPDPERDAIDEFIQEHIAPAQERRDNATRLLGEAASMPQAEIVQAWDKMRQAKGQDPHAPNLDEVHETLSERLRGYVEKQLKGSVQWLDDWQWEEACRSALAAHKAAALDDSLADLQQQVAGLVRRVQVAIEELLKQWLSTPVESWDVTHIKFLVDTLFDLKAPQADAWRQRILPRIHLARTGSKKAHTSAHSGMDRARLRQVLTKHFNKDELRNLYFDLDVDYDALPDQGKDAKIRELIAYFEHRGRTAELVDGIRQVRPGAI